MAGSGITSSEAELLSAGPTLGESTMLPAPFGAVSLPLLLLVLGSTCLHDRRSTRASKTRQRSPHAQCCRQCNCDRVIRLMLTCNVTISAYSVSSRPMLPAPGYVYQLCRYSSYVDQHTSTACRVNSVCHAVLGFSKVFCKMFTGSERQIQDSDSGMRVLVSRGMRDYLLTFGPCESDDVGTQGLPRFIAIHLL